MEDTTMLTAPCGQDCFDCAVHEGNITDALRKMPSVKFVMPPADVQCKGCRGQKGERLGDVHHRPRLCCDIKGFPERRRDPDFPLP